MMNSADGGDRGDTTAVPIAPIVRSWGFPFCGEILLAALFEISCDFAMDDLPIRPGGKAFGPGGGIREIIIAPLTREAKQELFGGRVGGALQEPLPPLLGGAVAGLGGNLIA